jgi:hypothetical protein
LNLERDTYMYRSYIGLEKFKLVLDELRSTQSEELKAVSLLAEYLSVRQAPIVDENKRYSFIIFQVVLVIKQCFSSYFSRFNS